MKKVELSVIETPEEHEERDRVAFAAWGAKLTPGQFLERERRLRSTAWARRVMRGWLLRGSDGGILSSCETFRMAMPAAGGPREIEAFASVLTEPRLRGRGYATRLLDHVMDRIRGENPSLDGFVLYSEVGTAIYERVGFRALESFEWVYPAETRPGQPGVERLDAAAFVARLGGGARPPLEQLEWHWERARFYEEALTLPKSRLRGLAFEGVFSAWVTDWKSGCLRALLFESGEGPGRAVAAVLEAARAEARRLELAEVRVWDAPGVVGQPDLGGRRVAREDAIAMACPGAIDLRPPSRGYWV